MQQFKLWLVLTSWASLAPKLKRALIPATSFQNMQTDAIRNLTDFPPVFYIFVTLVFVIKHTNKQKSKSREVSKTCELMQPITMQIFVMSFHDLTICNDTHKQIKIHKFL